jgi:hypothetical protein
MGFQVTARCMQARCATRKKKSSNFYVEEVNLRFKKKSLEPKPHNQDAQLIA